MLLGVGVGGFVDGILLHQILQWHHMISAERGRSMRTIAGLEANTVADGLFHAVALVVTIAAVALLTRNETPPVRAGRTRTGLLLAGWGGFNVVEGLVDHHLLRIHHVRDDVAHPLPWDLGFLVLSGALLGLGWWWARAGELPHPTPDRVPPVPSG